MSTMQDPASEPTTASPPADGAATPTETNAAETAPESAGEMPTAEPLRYDAVVVGGGLGGLATATRLVLGGFRVLCIEPDEFPHDRVGESLDWSAPGLLDGLGVPSSKMLADGYATPKRNIEIVATDRPRYTAQPEPWFKKPPIRFEVDTMHVDRVEMDRRLYERACEVGVEFLWQRVREVVSEGDRVTAVVTSDGTRVEAPWFVDSSGRGARLFARHFDIPKVDYGHPKVSFWTYFDTTPHNEGTTFYGDTSNSPYLVWIWEIPITPVRTSVGCVVRADHVKEQRRAGKSVSDILREELEKFPYFHEKLEERGEGDLEVRSTSYHSYVYDNAAGPNWIIVGEAASLPDPLTANGVTAAFRHAREGSHFILDSRERGELTARQRRVYNTNLKRMGHAFNHSIETSIYDWPIRWGLGVMPAQKVYTAFSYTVNAIYSRMMPEKRLSMFCFGVIVRGVWLWMESWSFLGKVLFRLRGGRRRRQVPAAAAAG